MDKITDNGINKDVLEKIIKDNALSGNVNERETFRVIVNAFCEMLSELQQMANALNSLNNTVAICGTDKILDYFTETNQITKTYENEKKWYNNI